MEQEYNPIKKQEVFVDETNAIVTEEELGITPLDVIRKVAESIGQELCDPNPGCKKCAGRGYIGRNAETKAPIPCSCIQPNFDSAENVAMYNRTRKYSRKERRQLDRDNRKKSKKRG